MLIMSCKKKKKKDWVHTYTILKMCLSSNIEGTWGSVAFTILVLLLQYYFMGRFNKRIYWTMIYVSTLMGHFEKLFYFFAQSKCCCVQPLFSIKCSSGQSGSELIVLVSFIAAVKWPEGKNKWVQSLDLRKRCLFLVLGCPSKNLYTTLFPFDRIKSGLSGSLQWCICSSM